MPRGQKSKARAREKRRQLKHESQRLRSSEIMAAERSESPSHSDYAPSGHASPGTSIACFLQSQGIPPTATVGICITYRRSSRVFRGQVEQGASSFAAQSSIRSPQNNLITKKTGLLMEYLLLKYKMKQPILREEMLRVIKRSFKEQFNEIFKKAINRLDLVFGLELKETHPSGKSFTLVSKFDFQDDGSSNSELGLPTRGILVPLLSVIYLNGRCASEEEVWHFLNMIGVYDEVPHLIFGNTRKLITEDLVQEKYLEYRQVAGSDPPRYEFLWGPRAHTEANKVKVMEFLASISEPDPSDFEEALKEEEARAYVEGAVWHGSTSKAKGRSKTKSSHSTK